ncbi:EAL domain-containing protein [Chelativorans sp. ZYF759]|uniref:GGDEF domain-containing phosphodiesterase n=1 Tax=Chelativorans sp. ZYF759 TaxID=2692213 RepID=UPI00145EBC13|nr:GGDEF domain-containing phosphodiesterase [Chelativorans sp. ZYF759]NMG38390.1 EAL domain-containing protein [Chelativorans sp. ZYF759]
MEDVQLANSMGLPAGDLFDVLTSAVPGFVWVSSNDGRIIYANPPWTEYCGLSEEEWRGFGWIKAVHPDDIATLDSAWKEAHAKGIGSYKVKVRCRHHTGVYRWQKIAMRRAPAADSFWIGCGVDIDDMIQAKHKDDLQLRMLEAVANGAGLETVLDMLCDYADFRLPGARCAILLVDHKAGTFLHGVSHSLPTAFTDTVRGRVYGVGRGSCGTAAALKKDVIVTSIATHPYWDGLRELVMPFGVRACWSRPIIGADGRVLATFGFYFDEERAPTDEEMSRMEGITHIATMSIERTRMVEALRESEEHYRHTVELNPQIPWIADRKGRILSVSTKWGNTTGLSPGQSLNDGWLSALHPDDVKPTLDTWRNCIREGGHIDIEYRLRMANGEYRWMRARAYPRLDDEGQVSRWYGTLEDIHQHRLTQDKMRRAAYEDELTRLNNRRRFEMDLAEALARRQTRTVGLIVLDLDDFKQVNDRFGHASGDAVLRLFANHLRGLLRPGEIAARLGGDEFAVILPDAEDEEILLQRASAITGGIDRQLRKSVKARNCNASAGAALSEAGDTAEELQRKADLALYQAKSRQRGGARLFSPEIRRESERRADEIELARKAHHAGWILPHYQPKIALTNGRMIGLEALIRVDHPEEGLLPPSRIMAALDHPRLGGKIGQRLTSKVIADLARLRACGIELGHVAINLSGENLRDAAFPAWLIRQMDKAGLPAGILKLEITERVLLDEFAEAASQALVRLRDKGIRISLDDFGTGYASLTHLQRFPVDEIKIDRSFIHSLAMDSSNAAIVKAMINLGRNLGMDVVAEGVETPTQALLLRSWGCHIAQGFLYSRPMAADAIPAFAAELSGSAPSQPPLMAGMG